MTALIGLFSAFLLIAVAISIGGSPAAFVSVPGMLIVILGTFAVTAVSFSLAELKEAPRTLARIFRAPSGTPARGALRVLQIAERARKKGLLDLDRLLPAMRHEPFLAKSLQLLVDGHKGDEVEKIMRREAGAIAERNARAVDVLRRAGEVAPALGLIGTLVGLVQMLARLDDPAAIGPAMAIALLTTFYGAILAHMVFLPLAARAERMSAEEELLNSVYALGISSIGRRENPRRLEMMINSLLPPAQKIRYFDGAREAAA